MGIQQFEATAWSIFHDFKRATETPHLGSHIHKEKDER